MTQYTLRVTIAVPEALIPAANQLALAIGESRNDDKTFDEPRYQDGDGNHYAVASTVAIGQFPTIAASDLETEAIKRFGEEHPVDLALAQQAQAALAVWSPSLDPDTGEQVLGPQAAPDAITAVVHDDPHQALQWLGLGVIQAEEPVP